MLTVPEALFTLTVVWLTIHELDAIRAREWRFFFARVPVDDETAYRVFVVLHVPLFALVLSWLDVRAFQLGLDAFAVVHAGLHLGLRDHSRLAFDGWFSWVWIVGAALFGALHLLVTV